MVFCDSPLVVLVLILRSLLDSLPPVLSCAASIHMVRYVIHSCSLCLSRVQGCNAVLWAWLFAFILVLSRPYNPSLWRGRVGYVAAVYSMPEERLYWTYRHVVYASGEVCEFVVLSDEIKFRIFLVFPPPLF